MATSTTKTTKSPLEKYLDERVDHIAALYEKVEPMERDLHELAYQNLILFVVSLVLVGASIVLDRPLLVLLTVPVYITMLIWARRFVEAERKLEKTTMEIRMTADQLQMLSEFASSIEKS